MSKDWDRSGVAFSAELWSLVYRKLKPGGVVKVFSATRTYHRLAQVLEEVGFQDLKMEAWGYGCLSEDTEILTAEGWKLGVDVQQGEKVAAWDAETSTIQLEAVAEVIRAPFEGQMTVFRNDNTDQLLTPNHRVYHRPQHRKMEAGGLWSWYEPKWDVKEAGLIPRWNHMFLPLAGMHHGQGIGGPDWARLLAWVWAKGGFDDKGTGVRIYQSSVNPEHVQEIQDLLDKLVPEHEVSLCDRGHKGRPDTEFCWFFSGETAQRVREDLPGKHPTWKLLWGMSQEEKHAFVSVAIKSDGSTESGCPVLYQKDPRDLVWFQTLAHLMDRQGRVNFDKGSVSLHMIPQTQFQSRHLRESETSYKGVVWCVRVPSGAFLARRKDKVFITGNSGFPKNLNVSRGIDKYLGVEEQREVVGVNPSSRPNSKRKNAGEVDGFKGEGDAGSAGVQYLTKAASSEAALWEGYGTALRPSWEPFMVGYKPI